MTKEDELVALAAITDRLRNEAVEILSGKLYAGSIECVRDKLAEIERVLKVEGDIRRAVENEKSKAQERRFAPIVDRSTKRIS